MKPPLFSHPARFSCRTPWKKGPTLTMRRPYRQLPPWEPYRAVYFEMRCSTTRKYRSDAAQITMTRLPFSSAERQARSPVFRAAYKIHQRRGSTIDPVALDRHPQRFFNRLNPSGRADAYDQCEDLPIWKAQRFRRKSVGGSPRFIQERYQPTAIPSRNLPYLIGFGIYFHWSDQVGGFHCISKLLR